MGTNKAFIGKADGEGQSTKAAVTQSLLQPKRFQKDPNALQDAGPLGTNSAFVGKGDGAGQSTKATKTQSLLMPKRFQKGDKKVELPAAGEVGTNKAFIGKGDGAGQSTKATTQSLLMPKRFKDLGMSHTQRNLHHAEEAAGLTAAVVAKEHLHPHAVKVMTQALHMPSRFAKPTTESQRIHYEESRAIGAQRHRSTGGSLQQAEEADRSGARRRAEANRQADYREKHALDHAAQEARRMHAGKARTTELNAQYLDYGRKARSFYVKHGIMSKKESEWADKLQSGWEKAPVTMLAECGKGGPCSAVPEWDLKHGITSAKEEAWGKTFPVESAADKARTMSLSMSDDFDPQGQGDDNYGTGVSSEIHHQYAGVQDNNGFPSTGMLRAPTQALLMPHRFTPVGRQESRKAAMTVPVPDAFGTLGTAAKPSDAVFNYHKAAGMSKLKQIFSGSARRVGADVTKFLFAPAHSAGF